MIISAIVAQSENRCIGINNQLPWHLPADLKHFKKITTGFPILMGRKTYESIGRPLPGRTNLILTRDLGFEAAGCIVIHSLEAAFQQTQVEQASELFIIGGATVYTQAWPHLNRIYMTLIQTQIIGDTYFPLLGPEWVKKADEFHEPDEHNVFAYQFLVWERQAM